MKRNSLMLLSGLALLGGISLLLIANSSEPCPDPVLQPNFDPKQYLGIWYENARDGSIKFEKGDCQVARYSSEDLETEGKITVINS